VPDGTAVFETSRLARVRAGRVVASIFGGSDVPALGRIGSGLANSAVLARLQAGEAAIDGIRLSTDFFGLGPFRADTWEVQSAGDIVLRSRVEAGYYQPLAPDRRRADGAYGLEGEGRFFATMSFADRATTSLALATTARVHVDDRGLRIDWRWQGPETTWTLDLVLRPGGVLEGTEDLGDGRHVLTAGWARYAIGDTTLLIEAGESARRQAPHYDPGELVTAVGREAEHPGLRVVAGGSTAEPFALRVRVESAEAAA
jgi:hypothetical protein